MVVLGDHALSFNKYSQFQRNDESLSSRVMKNANLQLRLCKSHKHRIKETMVTSLWHQRMKTKNLSKVRLNNHSGRKPYVIATPGAGRVKRALPHNSETFSTLRTSYQFQQLRTNQRVFWTHPQSSSVYHGRLAIISPVTVRVETRFWCQNLPSSV